MKEGQKVWKVDSSVRFRRLFDEAVLIHQEKAEALVLNDTAVSFIEGCDGQRTVAQVIETMLVNFEVSAAELAADLEPFIHQLAGEGIIKEVSGTNPADG
jgi:Coenzyme PQQ synthesis protein D (PqqD)